MEEGKTAHDVEEPPPAMEDVVEEPLVEQQVKLPQSEAIMQAIIRSSKPLPINLGGPDLPNPCAWPTRVLQQVSDRLVPWRWCRWIALSIFVGALTARVVLIERQFFVAYVLAIYIFQQFLLFISPAIDDDELHTMESGGEFRPFVRALSEFLLWQRSFCSTGAALLATFADFLDVDVDGHALVMYFVLLFFYTMRQQIQHMIKYRYVPWSGSKKGSNKEKGKKDETYDV